MSGQNPEASTQTAVEKEQPTAENPYDALVASRKELQEARENLRKAEENYTGAAIRGLDKVEAAEDVMKVAGKRIVAAINEEIVDEWRRQDDKWSGRNHEDEEFYDDPIRVEADLESYMPVYSYGSNILEKRDEVNRIVREQPRLIIEIKRRVSHRIPQMEADPTTYEAQLKAICERFFPDRTINLRMEVVRTDSGGWKVTGKPTDSTKVSKFIIVVSVVE